MLASEQASSRVQRVLALRTFAGFAGLAPSELAVMAELLKPRFFPKGARLIEPGVPVKALHMILDGRVELTRGGRMIREYGSKDVVGGLSGITRDPDGEEVVALDDTLTFEFDVEDMEEVFEDNFNIQLTVLRGLASQLLRLRQELGVRAGYPPIDSKAPQPEVGELWLVERMKFLRRTLPFGGAHLEAIADLAQSARELRIPAGHRLWREGDPSGFTITLLNGIVDCRSEDRRFQFEFAPLSVLGALDSMANAPRWYEAVCRTPIVALRGETVDMVDFMEDHPSLASEMQRLNARAIMQLNQQLAEKRDSRLPGVAPVEPEHE